MSTHPVTIGEEPIEWAAAQYRLDCSGALDIDGPAGRVTGAG